MTFADILITMFEIILVAVTIWCLFNEDKLVAFEEKIKFAFRRRRLKVVRSSATTIHFSQNR